MGLRKALAHTVMHLSDGLSRLSSLFPIAVWLSVRLTRQIGTASTW